MVWTGSSWGRIQCGQDLCEAGCSTRSVAGGIQVVVDPVSARSRCCEIHVGWFVLCFRWEWGPGVCQVHEGSQVLRPHSYQLQTGCLWHTAQCKYHKVPGTQTAQYKYHRVLVYWGSLCRFWVSATVTGRHLSPAAINQLAQLLQELMRWDDMSYCPIH